MNIDPDLVKIKRGLAQMLKGGVIMDVQNAEQAKIAGKCTNALSYKTIAFFASAFVN